MNDKEYVIDFINGCSKRNIIVTLLMGKVTNSVNSVEFNISSNISDADTFKLINEMSEKIKEDKCI